MTTKSTYDLASAQIAAYVQPLWHGALALPVDARDLDGRTLSSNDDHLSGHPLLLVFLNGAAPDATTTLLRIIEAGLIRTDTDIRVVIVCSDSSASRNRAVAADAGFTGPVVMDSTGGISAAYGVHKGGTPAIRIVAVTPMRQIQAWFDDPDDPETLIQKLQDMMNLTKSDNASPWAPYHAPVLCVPNVLSPEECDQLIKSFEQNVPFTVRPPRPGELTSDYQIPVYEHNRQDRVDQIIQDKNTLALLDERIWGRIAPMVKKAFAFDISRRENLHIARYVGERGGNQMGHRDNTSPATAYRRFALSMNLNDNYEGGEVVFREFSDRGYKSAPGTALIFSSSLLHEVLETTKGTRYTLISHLFNEQSLQRN